MQIVVNIHEKDYQSMKNGHIPFSILDAIMKGTPLPKGHGDLIDRDALDQEYDKLGWWEDTDEFVTSPMQDILFDAPTIIEADKTESEDKE